MELLLLIFSIVGVLEIIIAICRDWRDTDNAHIIFGSGITMILICIISIIVFCTTKEIEPIEVYRGNTTLQITYKDSIPIDSVVVYKNK